MRGLVDYTDFLVICTGRTPRQAKSIADEVRHRLKKDFGVTPRRVEGVAGVREIRSTPSPAAALRESRPDST
ncbi:MAG: RsfS/YbeB/iojap family protein [Miltoncostaeaceae bacterium]